MIALAACSSICAQPALHPDSWELVYRADFENGQLNDWTLVSNPTLMGSWSLVKEGSNTFLELTNQVTLALAQRTLTDFHLRLRYRWSGQLVFFRAEGCRRYFVALTESIVGLARQTCGPDSSQSASSKVNVSDWHYLDLVAIGAAIKIYQDGVLKLDVLDSEALYVGSLQLGIGGPDKADFDDLEIYGPSQLTAADQLQWVKTGGPPGGIGYDVRMRLDQPSRMYATDTFSGVNISDDDGKNWFASNNGITARAGASNDAIPIFTLTVDPHNPDTIWAGTRNGRGVFKSVDAGKSWVEKTRGIVEFPITFRGVTIDPNNPEVVYAAAQIATNTMGRRFGKATGVVYRSADSGENWSAIWRGDALARYIWVDPGNSDVIYVSTGFFDVEAANADPKQNLPGGVGVVKSTDGGKTWRALNQSNGITDLSLGSLAMHPQNPAILLAAAGDQAYEMPQLSGVFVTSDGGETWNRGRFAGAGSQASEVSGPMTAVAFSPTDGDIAYAAGPGRFLRSADAGKTWRAMSLVSGGSYGPPGLRSGMPVALQVDPRDPNRVFQNNYAGGNFLTEDGGRTWQLASQGYTGAQMRSVAVDPGDPLHVYAGGTPGLFRSDNGGAAWLGLNSQSGLDFAPLAITPDPPDPTQSGVILTSDESFGTIYRSTDGGLTSVEVFRQPGLYTPDDFGNRHGFKAIVFAPSNPRIVYAGMSYYQSGIDQGRLDPGYGIAKSTDGGLHWAYVNDANTAGQNVSAIAVDPQDENTVYVGTIQGGFLVTHHGGSTWTPANQGLPSRDVRSLAIDPTNLSTIYAGLENGGVWKSTNGGAAWQFASAGLDPVASIRNLVMDPLDSRILYAGEPHTGVFRSIDGGALWVPVNRGLTTRAVTSLSISRDGGSLWAATDGEGVFRLPLRSTGAAEGVAGREPPPRGRW